MTVDKITQQSSEAQSKPSAVAPQQVLSTQPGNIVTQAQTAQFTGNPTTPHQHPSLSGNQYQNLQSSYLSGNQYRTSQNATMQHRPPFPNQSQQQPPHQQPQQQQPPQQQPQQPQQPPYIPQYQANRPKASMSPTTSQPLNTTTPQAPSAGGWSTAFYRGNRFPTPNNAAAYGNYTPPQSQGPKMPTASPSASQNGADSLSRTNLYIRGLTPNTTDKDLVNLCQQYGKIMSTKAILDPQTNKCKACELAVTSHTAGELMRYGKILSAKAIVDLKTNECKGYGFVDFDNLPSAELAVKALQAQGVQAQMAKQQEQDPTNLYIANLPTYMTESDLETIFSPFGQVISTRILRDPNGISRGVGFARMESKEKCEQIIASYHGKCLPGWKEALTVKFADGGNKKKNPPKQWVDRGDVIPTPHDYLDSAGHICTSPNALAMAAYEQAATCAIGSNGHTVPTPQPAKTDSIAPTVMTPPAMMQRYTMATTPVTSYQLPAGFMYQPQLMQQQLGATVLSSSLPGQQGSVEPTMLPSIATGMQQLQLSAAAAGQSYMPGTMTAGATAAYNPAALAYPQPQGTPIMQGIPTIEQWNVSDAANQGV